ncbi:unnamed protein product [Arctogadus glacialis]
MHVPCSICLRSTWILCLIGCILSLPVDKGFGSNNPSPAWSDFSSPRSTYPVGRAGSVSQQNSYPEELVAPMDQEREAHEEEPVLSDVSDLEPVYHFSSGSRYQQGRRAFFLTRYNPGEPMVSSADTLVSNGYGMGNGEGGPADQRQPGKGDY